MGFPVKQVHPPEKAKPPCSSSGKVLLLGLGNELLADDAVGLLVARKLEKRLAGRPGTCVMATEESGLSLLDMVVGFDRLVVVDAIQTGQSAPGTIHVITQEDLGRIPLVSPHFVGIVEMLDLGRRLRLHMPEDIAIFAIEVQDVQTICKGMTATVKAALPGIITRVEAAI